MSRLLGVFSHRRLVPSVRFERMTFVGFQAQLLMVFMSRYSRVSVEFLHCAFKDYRRYTGSVTERCRDLKLTSCVVDPSDYADFIATTVHCGAETKLVRASRCLAGVYVLTGGTV